MFFSKKNITNYIIIFIISFNLLIASCFAQGIFIKKAKLKKFHIGCPDDRMIRKIGEPVLSIKMEGNLNIFIYYYLDQSERIENGINRRCLMFFFDDKRYLGYELY